MGDYSESPLYFRYNDCSSVSLYVDWQSNPSQPLQPNYEADKYRTLTLLKWICKVIASTYCM